LQFGPELLDLVDILILNETELGLLAGIELRDTDDSARIIEATRSLQDNGGRIVCVTLGKRGVVALAGNEPLIVPAARSRPSIPPAPAIALSARSRHNWRQENQFAKRWTTPTSPPRSAYNE